MTYNNKSVTFSIRIDRDALAVLKFKARLDGEHLATRVRETLEAEAEEVSERLELVQPPTPYRHDGDATSIAEAAAVTNGHLPPDQPEPDTSTREDE